MRLGDVSGVIKAGVLYGYIRAVNGTSHYVTRGEENIELAGGSRRPVVWALWHGLNLAFVMWAIAHHRQANAAPIVVVDDGRAVHLRLLARAFGVNLIEVSAGKGGASGNLGLRAMFRHLKPGLETFICPDAPAGPADMPKRGVYLIARRTKALVLPFGVWGAPAARMARWDNNLLPIPFSRMTAVVGEPLDVDQFASEQAFQTCLKDRLTGVRREARELSRAQASAHRRSFFALNAGRATSRRTPGDATTAAKES